MILQQNMLKRDIEKYKEKLKKLELKREDASSLDNFKKITAEIKLLQRKIKIHERDKKQKNKTPQENLLIAGILALVLSIVLSSLNIRWHLDAVLFIFSIIFIFLGIRRR